MSSRFDFRPGETVRSRFFPYKELVVIDCDGCIADVRNPANGDVYPVAVGEIRRITPEGD